jgi:Zn-dependent protease
MDVIDLAFSLAIGFVAVLALTILVNAVKVSRIRLKAMRAEPIDLPRVPESARAILDVGRRWLQARGFRYLSSWKLRPIIAKASEWKYGDVYVDADGTTFALVSPRELPRPGDITGISFDSLFPDGTFISTVNRARHSMIWEHPDSTYYDDYVADLETALASHRQRVRDSGKAPISDPAERDRIANARLAIYLDGLVESGHAHRSPDGEVRLRFVPAVKFVIKVLQGNSRAAKVKIVPLDAPGSGAPAAAAGDGKAGIAADMHAYFTRRAGVASASGKGKAGLGALSAVAFIALGAFLWDPVFAVILLGVIAFHEGGHYLAMKAVGYRNLNVFFLPGLGGIATGDKQDATATEKMLVYLAGPVPGIVLATAGMLAIPNETMAEFEWLGQLLNVMLFINMLNLLPVTPLDGGRVLEVLLFMRWPRLRLAFAALSAAALVAWGALFGEKVMLVIGILMALGLPAQARFSRLARTIGRKPEEKMDERSAAQRVFSALATAPFAKWDYQQRVLAADELIAELRTPIPGIGKAGAGLTLYAACLVAPIVAALVASPMVRTAASAAWEAREALQELSADSAEMIASVGPVRDWDAELERARSAPPEARLALLTEAAEAGHVSMKDGVEGLKTRTDAMRKMADSLPRGSVVRVRALLVIANERDDGTTDEKALRALREELGEANPETAYLRGRIDALLAGNLEPSAERAKLMGQARDAMRPVAKPGDVHLAEAWTGFAQELSRNDAKAADEEWKALLGWYATAPAGDAATKAGADGARSGYAMFLIRQARFDDAEALLQPSATAAVAEAQGKRLRLMRQSPAFQTLFWLSIRKGDGARSAEWLDDWGKALGPSLAKRSPHYALARLAAADLAHDDKRTQEMRQHLIDLPATQAYFCKSLGNMYDGTELATRQAGLVKQYGICKAQAG